MPITIKEHIFNTGTISLIYAEVSAAGSPLVLLHGGASQWRNFEILMPDLAENWHLYALDLRGHGKSGRVKSYRLQDFADDVIVFLREVVVGDSPLTAETWKTVLDTDREDLLLTRASAGGQVSLEEVAKVVHGIPPIFVYQTDPEVYTALLDDFENTVVGYEMESLLPAVQCPVLLLQADPNAGGLMMDAEVARAMLLLPKPSHVFLPGLSHVLHNEQKEPVLEVVKAFLNAL